jgi:UDP-N-acetylglucosamine:LPS N-acetylglucosamine transferase
MEIEDSHREKIKICIVTSCGGHLTEVRCLKQVYQKYSYFYVVNDKIKLSDDMPGKTFFIAHSERDWLFIVNMWEALKIIFREKPNILLSTGAGPVVPFAIIGRLLFGVKIIYIETITRISSPSLTGKIMYILSHHFFYQWKSLEKYFPKGIYGGTVV